MVLLTMERFSESGYNNISSPPGQRYKTSLAKDVSILSGEPNFSDLMD